MSPRTTSALSAIFLVIAMASFFYFSINFPIWALIPFMTIFFVGFFADILSSERYFSKMAIDKKISFEESVKRHEINLVFPIISSKFKSKKDKRVIQCILEFSIGLLAWGLFSHASEEFNIVMYGLVMMFFGIIHLTAFYGNFKLLKN
jgi:hypothetical protein